MHFWSSCKQLLLVSVGFTSSVEAGVYDVACIVSRRARAKGASEGIGAVA